jgi:tetratricopeptide (TPR) repeat protein
MTTCCRPRLERSVRGVRTAATLPVLFAVLFVAVDANAEPYRPERTDQVLVRLPSSSVRSASLQSPDALVDAAMAEMALGRRTLDERHFGRAEALLLRALPCASRADDRRRVDGCRADVHARGLVAYADMLQHGHDFEAADQTLTLVLNHEEANAQARLMRASIRLASGEPRAALSDCTKLIATADTLVATACIAQSISLSGRLNDAVELLTKEIEKHQSGDERLAWALAILAEMLERQGQYQAALATVERAIRADLDNVALRLQAIDLLLRQQGAQRAMDLLATLPDAESVILRRALAAQALKAPQAAELHRQWQRVVAEQERLGIPAHERDRALGELLLMNRPAQALVLASANWQKSREVEDARMLIRAARAAGQVRAATPAFDWIRAFGVEDAWLAAAEADKP